MDKNEIIKIGYLDGSNNTLHVDTKYKKTIKNLTKFSHVHVFYLDKDCILDTIIELLEEINETTIKVNTNISDIYPYIDIKPYMLSEDSILNETVNKIDYYPVSIKNGYVQEIGKIRNDKGLIYLELNEELNIKNQYLKVYWWFDKFDKELYRSVYECNPPYENAPRSGVFSTRSPVRPNPIAFTIVYVEKVDKENKRIYINGIESFDKTPLLGIIGYDTNCDLIKTPTLPSYLAHWPKCINFSNYYKDLSNIEVSNSLLSEILSQMDETNIVNNVFT